jgi:nitrite reductase/ring-hydroxylating ferredoxin subunit
MFKNIFQNINKYKWVAINASFITCTYLNKKIHNKLFMQEKEQQNNDKFQNQEKNNFNPHSNSEFKFQTLKDDNKNLDPSNPSRKIDSKIKRIIGEYRAAALFEDYSDLFLFSDEYVPLNEKVKMADQMDWSQVPSVRRKKFEEEYMVLGDETVVPNRQFIQVDIDKMRNSDKKKPSQTQVEGQKQEEDELYLNDPERYFQKILVFRINDNLYATSSFCGYDLTDLKNGAMLGNKLVCPTCLSEYNVENGMSEAGPNTRYLATFPVAIRKGQVMVKVPMSRLPLFTHGPVAEPNELDPRHYIIIGDNETVFSCVDTLLKTYSGKISIITNQCGNNFVDQNKLVKSFFPLKMRHARFFEPGFLDFFNIQVYDEKVLAVDGIKRMVTLSSGNKLPFDKVLIAVGSNRKPVNRPQRNCYELNTIRDHAQIHNAIIKPDVKSIAIIGNTFRSLEIASSIRRYLDAIDKQSTKVFLITKQDNWIFEKLGLGDPLIAMMTEYLKRNRIFVFRGNKDVDFEESKEENNMKKAILVTDKFAYKLPADVFIFDNPVIQSNLDFLNKIQLKKTVEGEETFGKLFGNVIVPDERMSLHTGDRYPHIFTGGSCSAIKSNLIHGLIRTDNVKSNFHLGYIAALNMMEVHYPFDDVIVNQSKLLDKNLYFVGNDNMASVYEKVIAHVDPVNERYVIYYFCKNKMTSVLIYGYNRLHIFMREAMKLNMLPDYKYVNGNKDKVHLQITEEVIKRQNAMDCFRHKALKETLTTNTYKYSVEDQSYSDDIMKRGLSAYKAYEEKVNEQVKKNLELREQLMQKRREDMENKIRKQREEQENPQNQES